MLGERGKGEEMKVCFTHDFRVTSIFAEQARSELLLPRKKIASGKKLLLSHYVGISTNPTEAPLTHKIVANNHVSTSHTTHSFVTSDKIGH